MFGHNINPSWVEKVNMDAKLGEFNCCAGCIGDTKLLDEINPNSQLCESLPGKCRDDEVFKWKVYVDPCPLERNTSKRKFKKFKDSWFERIDSEDKSCNNCGLVKLFKDEDCLNSSGCIAMSYDQAVYNFYCWKAI